MPSVVRLPQTASPLNVLVIECENQERAALSAVIDDALPAGGQGASDPTAFLNCHDAQASASTELSDEIMPPDKSPTGIEMIPSGGFAADGSVSLESTTVGYVALCCKGVGTESTMFKGYQTACIQPAVDAAQRRLELDPDDPLARSASTTDRGVTRLMAAISEELFDQKLTRNDDHAKLSKN